MTGAATGTATGASTTSITPCLWYEREAEEAARFYVSLLPNSRVDHVQRAPGDYPGGQSGDVIMVAFTLAGMPYQALNGRVDCAFNNSVSLSVSVDSQSDVDRLWDALVADGGAPIACGWLKDRWGLRWQIVPRPMFAFLSSDDKEASGRAYAAMMTMTKLDLPALEAAFRGDGG